MIIMTIFFSAIIVIIHIIIVSIDRKGPMFVYIIFSGRNTTQRSRQTYPKGNVNNFSSANFIGLKITFHKLNIAMCLYDILCNTH